MDFAQVLVVAVAAIAFYPLRGKYHPTEFRVLALSFGAHVVASYALVYVAWVVYEGWADAVVYHSQGRLIARALEMDFNEYFPDVLRLFTHNGNIRMPVEVWGQGGSSGALAGLSGLLVYLLGDSKYATTLAVSMFSFFGKLALVQVWREVFPRQIAIYVIAATMLLPSCVFWSCGLTKEAIAVAGVSMTTLGVHRAMQGRWAVALLLAIPGILFAVMVKPYVVFAFVIAGGVWVYWHRATKNAGDDLPRLRPITFVVTAVAAVFFIVALGEAFPRFRLDDIAEETARLQGLVEQTEGGSDYVIGDPTATTFAGQLAFAPFAMFSSFFRPLPFEARNGPMVIAAVEMMALFALLVRGMLRQGFSGTWYLIMKSPTVMFATCFAALFGVAVGLASTNLGTLSRYRMPMMPYYAALLAVLNVAQRRQLENAARAAEDRESTGYASKA